MYYCCALTYVGIREHNEDAILVDKSVLTQGVIEKKCNPPFLVAVADGVSGERTGDLASSMCLEAMKHVNLAEGTNLSDVINSIHEQLTEYSSVHPESTNMQTTLCGFGITKDHVVHTFNVGDSRLYRYSHGILRQLSRDQSVVQTMFEKGMITRSEQKTCVFRNVIFPVLGNLMASPQLDVELFQEGMDYGDLFLLCTDGLSDYVEASDIEEILSYPKPLARRLRLLVEKALEGGSVDNISVILLSRIAE